MAIRSRFSPAPPKSGYPDMEFRGYVRRFGETQAQFFSAKMQVIAGSNEPVKGPGIPEIYFYTMSQLAFEVSRRAALNHNWRYLQDVINNWPSMDAGSKLRSFTFKPYGS